MFAWDGQLGLMKNTSTLDALLTVWVDGRKKGKDRRTKHILQWSKKSQCVYLRHRAGWINPTPFWTSWAPSYTFAFLVIQGNFVEELLTFLYFSTPGEETLIYFELLLWTKKVQPEGLSGNDFSSSLFPRTIAVDCHNFKGAHRLHLLQSDFVWHLMRCLCVPTNMGNSPTTARRKHLLVFLKWFKKWWTRWRDFLEFSLNTDDLNAIFLLFVPFFIF